MTIDEAISHLNTYSSTMGSGQTTQEQHEDAKRVAIDTMRKYQKMQADYEARLKADMVAILTEIQLEIKKQKYRELTEDECGFKFGISTASNIVQQKINSLKAEIEPQESEVEDGNDD